MTRNERIKHAISEKKTPQRAIAELLDVRVATVNTTLNSEEEINSIKFIEAVSQLTGFSRIWLAFEIGKEMEEDEKEWRADYNRINGYFSMKEEQILNNNRTIRMMHQINDQKDQKIEELKNIIIKIGGKLPPEF